MIFKVGDRVIVRKPENLAGLPIWIPEMDKYDGKVVTLKRRTHNGFWKIEAAESDGNYSFAESWLTPAEDVWQERTYEDYLQFFGLKIGDRVEVDGRSYNPFTVNEYNLNDCYGDERGIELLVYKKYRILPPEQKTYTLELTEEEYQKISEMYENIKAND